MNKTIYSKDYEYLIEQLKVARAESLLSQKEVAHVLGISQGFISKIESGQVRLDIVQLRKLSKIYKKDIHFFLRNE